MNGKKKKNKKLVLDSGKVNHFLEETLASNHFNVISHSTLKIQCLKFHIFSRKKLKRNESQIEESFHI